MNVKNVIRRSPGEWAFDIGNTLFLTLLMVVTLYPLIYVLFASVSEPIAFMNTNGLLVWPVGQAHFKAYELVLKYPMVLKSYANTIFYVLAGTSLNLIMTSFGAYVLSRQQFMLRNGIMFLITFTMFFSGGLIPSYLLVRSIGIFNTRLALILPTAMTAYNMIVMRTGFASLPVSLEESARIDGARDFRILFQIAIPLMMPVVSVMILFYGVANWNSWFNAMVYLNNRELFPLQLILREILIGASQQDMLADVTDATQQVGLEELVKYATIVIATLPILCVYPMLQKYFVKGVMIGAIKQ